MSIKTYPNQRVYRVYKDNKQGAPRVQLDKDYFEAAFQILTKSELGIWLDIVSNKENYTWSFSSQDFAERYKMGASTARAAFTGLIEKGFLELIGGNRYKVHPYSVLEKYNYIYDEQEERAKKAKEEKIKEEDLGW